MTTTVESIRTDINREVSAMISRQRPVLLEISNDLDPMLEQLETLLVGGKRLRPLFGYCGLKVAGGTWGVAEAKALASLEFLQACARQSRDATLVIPTSGTRGVYAASA